MVRMRHLCFTLFVLGCVARAVAQQRPEVLTWEQVRERFEQNNPTLLAAKLNVDETLAQEITAYLRPNPAFTLSVDGTQIAPGDRVWKPFSGTFVTPALSYLHERGHKRELRRESARKGTGIAASTEADAARTLLFDLRSAFVSTLQAKAVWKLAQDNLTYYDHVLDVSRDRLKAGDIAQVDLDRLELQRVQYESDLQTAQVNLRTAKIQLLTLLNDRTPLEEFDVTGSFDFVDQLAPRDDLRKMALAIRPDLQAALEAVEKAQTDRNLAVANGSTDPTFSGWLTNNPSTNNPFASNTVGVSVSVPLRIFDRNQGEKLRTQIEVSRAEKLREAAEALVLSDVDSGYATLESTLNLLRPYKQRYLRQAVRVRDTVSFSYQNGGASLLEFLSAEAEYRNIELSYTNLIGSYLTAAAQLNLAVGREVIP